MEKTRVQKLVSVAKRVLERKRQEAAKQKPTSEPKQSPSRDAPVTEQEIVAEVIRLTSEKDQSSWRFFVRSLRIACGVALAAIAYWLLDSAPDVPNTPLASLTLKAIVGYVVHIGAACMAFAAAFAAAFGKGPAPESDTAIRERAAANVLYQRKHALFPRSFEHKPSWIESPFDPAAAFRRNPWATALLIVLVVIWIANLFRP